MDIKMLWVWNVHVVSNRWLIGGLSKKRSPTHPHLGGMQVKALRSYALGRKKLPESTSLT